MGIKTEKNDEPIETGIFGEANKLFDKGRILREKISKDVFDGAEFLEACVAAVMLVDELKSDDPNQYKLAEVLFETAQASALRDAVEERLSKIENNIKSEFGNEKPEAATVQ